MAARESPIFCANNCGFFGNAATMNLCSKCYRDTDQQLNPARSTKIIEISASSRAAEQIPVMINMKSSVSIGSSRCNSCNKRLGLTALKCRCGNFYCGSHRYSDMHECTFDYRAAGRESIAKANPVVVASKINKI